VGRSAAVLLLVLALISVAAFALAAATPALHEFVIATLIDLVVVVGVYVFIGNSGVLSFGQVSFMAIGAYATGLLTVKPATKGFLLPDLPHAVAKLHFSTFPAMIVVTVGVGVVAAVVGLPLMRLAGIAASIATLSMLIVVNVVIVQTPSWTSGNQAFIGVPLTTTTLVAVAGFVFAAVVAFLFEHSATGLRLRASREDDPAARAAGVNVVRERTIAFGLSGALIGLAGALYAHFLGSFDPSAFYLELAFITLAMLVVGGMYTLLGAIVGTIVIAVVQEILGRLENGEGVGPIHVTLHDGTTDVVLALVVIAVMLFRPGGIMARDSDRGRRRFGRQPAVAVDEGDTEASGTTSPPPAPAQR
jgi:branched-chain amino acid transport system permease protein